MVPRSQNLIKTAAFFAVPTENFGNVLIASALYDARSVIRFDEDAGVHLEGVALSQRGIRIAAIACSD